MLNSQKRIHFIGIGGIGMSGIAWLCLKKGHQVTGSDIKSSSIVEKLSSEGANISIGHRWENIKDIDIVVYSSAVLAHNPELAEASRRGIPVFKRGEFLFYMGEGKKCVAVTGAHGKTTTASIISTILKESGHNPSGIVGALVPYLNGNAFLGDGEYFVTEADESDGSFLYLRPEYGIITNIDLEHLDYYNDIEQIKKAYAEFAGNVKSEGSLICWGDDPYIKKTIKHLKAKILKYGKSRKNNLYVKNIKFMQYESEFDLFYEKKEIGKFRLGIPGEHNILNAMAAVLTALDMGISPHIIRAAVYKYKGAQRRFQEKIFINDIRVIDDYAHHPTEISSTLKAASNIKRKRLISVFQPHRFTRTKFLKKEFAGSFVETDYLVLTDIYAANEKPIFGITSMCIYNEVLKLKQINVNYIAKDNLLEYLLNFVKPGDMLLFLGAGDIGRLSGEFTIKLREREESRVEAAGI